MAYRNSYSSDSSSDSRDAYFNIQEKVVVLVKQFYSDDTDSSISQKLTGEIVDEQSIPIIGVIVELPEYNLHNETDEHGKFEFTVKAPKEAQVIFRARKQGFKTINHDPYLGGSFLSYTMRRKHD
ncbi:MAG: hypothetical protein U9N60_06685 [Thermodesulfobacteriota bacterium]|nr:hypothetical protein [Thermodesulfobacteriota bacterium]